MSANALPPIRRDTESRIIESLVSSDGRAPGSSLPWTSGWRIAGSGAGALTAASGAAAGGGAGGGGSDHVRK